MQGWRRKLTVVSLLVAAFATYVDVPRLHVALNLGDTLNALRVMDPVQHIRMQQLLNHLLESGASGSELATDLQDGNESLDLLSASAMLNGVVPPVFQVQLPALVSEDHQPGDSGYTGLTGLAGALLSLDLPPPFNQSLWQPPRIEYQAGGTFRLYSRAPPLALR